MGNAVTFDVSGDGTVYTIESENGDLLCSYTLSGERSEIAELPQKTDSIAFSDGRIYYTQTVDDGTEICYIDVSTADSEKLCVLSGLWQIKNLDIAGGNAYSSSVPSARTTRAAAFRASFPTSSGHTATTAKCCTV